MNQYQFSQICKKNKPKENHLKNILIAFISGGIFACIAQGVSSLLLFELNFEKNNATLITTYIVIFLTILFTGFGVYDKTAQYLGAGLFIPISGFANSLCSCALEHKCEGLIYGMGSNIFKLAGSVLTYGFVTSYLLSLLVYLFEMVGI